jgi:hypothetical protein
MYSAKPINIWGREGRYRAVLQTLCKTGYLYGNRWLKTRDCCPPPNVGRILTKLGHDVR